jgi:hypothetical protein
VLLAQPGAHLLQGDVGLRVDQAAQERLVRIQLRGARAALRPSGERAGRLDGSHPADGGGDAHPEASGGLTARTSRSRLHYTLTQILAVGSAHASLPS